jgi:hypothetical protein
MKTILGFLCIVLSLCCTVVHAREDMIGTWHGTSNSAVLGAGLHHHSPETDRKAIRFRKVDYTLTIDRQEGRNFSGTVASAHHSEIVLGALAKDHKTGVMVNEHGTFNFSLADTNALELCFTQVQTSNSTIPQVASCFEMKRR